MGYVPNARCEVCWRPIRVDPGNPVLCSDCRDIDFNKNGPNDREAQGRAMRVKPTTVTPLHLERIIERWGRE